MDLRAADGVALRFHAYIEHLSKATGHADRHLPLTEYCTGLLLPGERKSVEPMAARVAPGEVGAKHQSASLRGEGAVGRGQAHRVSSHVRAAQDGEPSTHPGLDRR